MTIIPVSIARQMTGIEWPDFSANKWIGCTRILAVSEAKSGCEICYAASFGGQRLDVTWGAGEPRRLVKGFDARMKRLDRLARDTGLPFSVFTFSLGDYLDAEVDEAWRSAYVDTVEACPHLTWLALTHRPHLARKLLPAAWRDRPPANLWPGVTIEHPAHAFRWKQHADYWEHTNRMWISAEPLAASLADADLEGARVIILGGASNTRDPSWAFQSRWVDEMVDRHGAERIFFKQHGVFRDGLYVGDKKKAGRDIEGRVYDNTPWPRHRDILKAAALKETA